MTDNLLLVSTCGTSVLTNGTSDEVRKWLTRIANATELPAEEQSQLDVHAGARRRQILGADPATRRRLSAELNGIAAVLAQWKPKKVFHLLVHTDTTVGRAAAHIIEEALRSDKQDVQSITADGLRTDHLSSFREALADLTCQLEEWSESYRGSTVLFNLTGGFKSINAYLQALGMLYADRCVFLFEGADSLMEIPRIPLRLADADEVREHLAVFRRLALRYPVRADEVEGIPESLLLVDGGQATTSVWGDVVWQRVRKALLSERLLAPLSPKLTLGRSVESSFDKLEAAQKCEVNEALDELSACLDGVRPLLRSRIFKPLQGDPRPPSTHELYAWSTGGTGRLFGHYEGVDFHFDALSGHL
jgi:putative CRISPR-associated protein (TIGR02619 family)